MFVPANDPTVEMNRTMPAVKPDCCPQQAVIPMMYGETIAMIDTGTRKITFMGDQRSEPDIDDALGYRFCR